MRHVSVPPERGFPQVSIYNGSMIKGLVTGLSSALKLIFANGRHPRRQNSYKTIANVTGIGRQFPAQVARVLPANDYRSPFGNTKERLEIARDERDVVKIEITQSVVAAWLDQIANLDPLEHPDSRWHPDDLRNALLATQCNLTAELERLRGPLLVVAE
jgi:hypothetical protein